MPELPEVETTRRGIEPHVLGRKVTRVIVRQSQLRWPIPAELAKELPGRRIESVTRRAKYLLLAAGDRNLMLHLGMSGRLRVLPSDTPAEKHDHLDIVLDNGQTLRLNDPRRFGAALWISEDASKHALLEKLGPEPLSDAFNGDRLFSASRGRKIAVKNFIMNSHIVVGVGNIYASEALFRVGIRPTRAAGRISRANYGALALAIKDVLQASITQGGTTLRDYVGVDGGTGYYQLELAVYGKAGQSCPRCGPEHPIRNITIGQRSSFFCSNCQH
ncbi:MAG: bifunctional DNA-formamidopyrimidine glycosylase/DNA-(apurinic or apyrimidinic site) lyase [Salinisphaeraceae bacterium]|nr:bifunctional DNA-formamidopyrimidine glycosylase/DNA-(apurinic or apyrimidinic site) lyase [Salinisphaeraceae bacterium]